MPTAQIGVTASGAGVSIQRSAVLTADSALGLDPTIPVAHAVGTWVKVDTNGATCVLASNHGQTNGTYDVYWGTDEQRIGVPGVVATDALTLNGGAGDEFPANAANDVVVCKQVAINAAIDGDELTLLAMSLEYATVTDEGRGHVQFLDSGSEIVEAVNAVAGEPQVWSGDVAQTQFTGNAVASVTASHNNIASNATLKLVVLQDSTP